MLSKQVACLFELRFQNIELTNLSDSLKKRNDNLNKFANVVSHDLRSPLSNIISLAELMKEENQESWSEESLKYLEYIKISSYSLKDYVDGILKFYKSDELFHIKEEVVNIKTLVNELKKIADIKNIITFDITGHVEEVVVNKTALMQILVNLITNGIKYNAKKEIVLGIEVSENADFYYFDVSDNGNGIPEEYLTKIFDLFTVVGAEDVNGNVGTGIVLAIVKKIVDSACRSEI